MSLSDIEREDKIDKLEKFMVKDIQAAIDGEANYLGALGLSTYTENLGGFLNGNFEQTSTIIRISFQNILPHLHRMCFLILT